MMPHDQYQTVQEVADRLRVSEATVRHWIKDGALRAIDLGKAWRISDADLDNFLHRHETRPRENRAVDLPVSPEKGGSDRTDRKDT